MLTAFRSYAAAYFCVPAVLVTVSAGMATAQWYPREVIAHCVRVASKMPMATCTSCDNFRDYVEHACEANGGRLPGTMGAGMEPFDTGPTADDRRAQ
jgi:hypothetical protein